MHIILSSYIRLNWTRYYLGSLLVGIALNNYNMNYYFQSMIITMISVRCGSRTGEQRKSVWRKMQVDIAGLSFIKVSNAAEEEPKWRRKARPTTQDSVTASWASEVRVVWRNPTRVHIYYCLREGFLKGNCQSCCRTNGIKGAYELLNDTVLSAAAIECIFVAFHLFSCVVRCTVSGESETAFSFHIPLTPPHGRWRILLPSFVAMMELIGKERGSLVGCKRHFRRPYVI